ncbi:MAG: mprA 2 [Gemmataceae bacterium]|nr:mprA 2 [Gemmataceae bacterium]
MTTPTTGTDAIPPPAPTGLQVLCVDDNHDAADSLGVLLGFAGHGVAVAHDARSALEVMAHGFRPEVCILDITMPGMDGCELARRVRDATGDRPPLLIALTALGDYNSLGRMADAGFDLHFEKPVVPQELFEALGEFARRSRPDGSAG